MNRKIEILHMLDGARCAKGLTVIIDVFRAFSMECYLYNAGVTEIRPVGSIEDALHGGAVIRHAYSAVNGAGKSVTVLTSGILRMPRCKWHLS